MNQTLIPTVIEEGTRGERAFDIYSLLLRERIDGAIGGGGGAHQPE